jgi:sugar phosphate isomerase/epimerase
MDATRRGFLGGAIGATFGPSLAPAFAGGGGRGGATGGDTGDLKLGVASYSFREFSRKIAIAGTKKLNTPYINFKDMHLPLNTNAADMEKFHKEVDKAGLTIMGGGNVTFSKDDEADIRSKFEYAKAAGFPVIVCAPTHETLPKMEKYAKEFNIKIAVHNHGPEDKHFPTPQSVLEVVKNMDPRMGLCIDIGHTARTGADIVASVAEAGPRLHDMHVKDLSDPMKKDSQVPVGDGKLPIPALFRQLKKMNYQGGVMLEYEIDDTDPLPGMIKSFAYMRGVLAGIRG